MAQLEDLSQYVCTKDFQINIYALQIQIDSVHQKSSVHGRCELSFFDSLL